MSAYRNPPAGYAYLVFEMPPAGQLRFLTHVARSAKGRKVSVKGKALPHRTTKGALRLVVYLVPYHQVGQRIQQMVEALQEAFDRTASSIRETLRPVAGHPLDSTTRAHVYDLLSDWAARHCARLSSDIQITAKGNINTGGRLQVHVNPATLTQVLSVEKESTMVKEFCRHCGTRPEGEPAIGEAPPTATCPACGVPDPYKHPRASGEQAATGGSIPGAQTDPHPAG